jgi:trans-aconitate methyltransferase
LEQLPVPQIKPFLKLKIIQTMKPKDISREEYVKMFCHDRRIRERRVVYVSTETHEKLRRIAHLFRDEYQTVVSLADAIITHHIATYRPLLNRLDDEQTQAFLNRHSHRDEPAEEIDDETEDEPA